MEVPALDRNSEVALSRQLLEWFRDAALRGDLAGGERLPATRVLSSQLGVSRNTVCEAYELLAAEGYIECSVGSRARIAQGVALRDASYSRRSPSAAAVARASSGESGYPPIVADFRTGRPDTATIPRKTWIRAVLLASESLRDRDWLYGPSEGSMELRAEIASYLFRSRGIRVDRDSVFVTAGATHALHVLALVAARRGRAVAVEDPCHSGMLGTLRGVGLRTLAVEADESGMVTNALRGLDAGWGYVTPSHQFPLGGVLPAERRAELIAWARDRDAFVAEDDYDSEFRFAGLPVAPLWGMDPERVVYVGTFSKTLFPALRIGFALVPRALRDEWRDARVHSDVHNPPFEQAALAHLLEDRTADRHIARMKRRYASRRTALLESVARELEAGEVRVLGDASGLHIALRIRGGRFDADFERRARARGVRIAGAERHAIEKGRWTDTLLLGYGHLDERAIERGMALIPELLRMERAPD